MNRGNLMFFGVVVLVLVGAMIWSGGGGGAGSGTGSGTGSGGGSGDGGGSRPEVFGERLTLVAAKERAQQTGKPVLAFFTADWCPPCQHMKQTTLVEPSVVAMIRESAIPVYLDMSRAGRGDTEADRLLNQYGVQSFPTMVLLSGQQQAARVSGAVRPEDFKRWLTEAVARAAR